MSSNSTHKNKKNGRCKILRFKHERARRKRLVKNVILRTETGKKKKKKRRPLLPDGRDISNGTEAGAPVPAAAHSRFQMLVVALRAALFP